MKETESLILQGIKLEIATLTAEMQKLETKITAPPSVEPMPEWVNLETAAKLKGGGLLSSYKVLLFLQPCCGRNSQRVGGRKCWKKEEVIRWIKITDSQLKDYAKEWNVEIPQNYKERSKKK